MFLSRKYQYPTPPHNGGQRKFWGGGGGGSKKMQFPSGWGVAYRGFFPRGLSKIGELFSN